MGIFSRIFSIGKAEANAAIDRLEDPIKMTEQGIRDLKEYLNASIKSLAEVKALSIRAQKDAEGQKQIAAEYEKKAMLLLQKSQNGQLEPQEADLLASEALVKKEDATSQAVSYTKTYQNNQNMVAKLENNVKTLKNKIVSYENELRTLKARAKVSAATTKINKQLAQVDSNGTIAMLEKMKDKVNQQEALAESYGDIAENSGGIDAQINQALANSETPTVQAADSLAALKAKMKIS